MSLEKAAAKPTALRPSEPPPSQSFPKGHSGSHSPYELRVKEDTTLFTGKDLTLVTKLDGCAHDVIVHIVFVDGGETRLDAGFSEGGEVDSLFVRLPKAAKQTLIKQLLTTQKLVL